MLLKDKYGYIETWTGARWVREPNPTFAKAYDKVSGKYIDAASNIEIYPYGVIRLHPITNEWRPITDEDD